MTAWRAAVLGSPVAHSLSPTLHEAAYRALGLTEWSYAAHEVTADGLAPFVVGLGEQWRGLSLTMPLKEVAFDVAGSVSEIARRAGAVNTLIRRPDLGWDATNTDVEGIVAALRPHLPPDRLSLGRGLVLGTGATARSAALALRELGVEVLTVRGRDPGRVSDLAAWAVEVGGFRSVGAGPLSPWGPREAEIVISALAPAGSTAAAGCVRVSGARAVAPVVLDVVYARWPTPLARAATDVGLTVVSGFDMLVHQAAAQFALFTGEPAPVEAMFAAGRARLADSP